MKLTDLDPKWFDWNGARAGLTFLCPHCRKVYITCTFVAMKVSDQVEALQSLYDRAIVVPDEPMAWKHTGESFELLSITPSIDASKSGHWHGFISNGEAQ